MMGRSGLSLLELLVAIALLAIVSMGLIGALGLGIRFFERSAEQPDLHQSISVRLRLRDILSQARAIELPDETQIGFVGGPTGFSFATASEIPLGQGARHILGEVELSEGTLSLDLEGLDNSGASVSTYEAVLANDVEEAQFSYFVGGEWRAKIALEAQVPQLVRIELIGDTIPSWPDFTVKLLYAPKS